MAMKMTYNLIIEKLDNQMAHDQKTLRSKYEKTQRPKWQKKLTDRNELIFVVDEPLVHLIAEHQHIPLDAKVGDHLQLLPAEHLKFRAHEF